MNRFNVIIMSRGVILTSVLLFLILSGYQAFPQNVFGENRNNQAVEQSANEESSPSDHEEFLEFLAVLEEETEVATKTKMNSDYVPGMVTVLRGEHLEAMGVQSVAEALGLVPGIQVSRLRLGEPTVKVRGIAFPFNAGNIKVMLNSIPISRESSGISSSVLLTPVSQVDRIEVIRGPGSSIYGDFAMSGVVNIITKDSGSRIFAKSGDDHSKSSGGHYRYMDEESSFHIGLNASLTDDEQSAAVKRLDSDENRFIAVINMGFKDFSLTAEGIRRDIDSWGSPQPPLSGLSPGLPPGPQPGPAPVRSGQIEESWAIEGRQIFELKGSASLEIHLSYLHNSLDSINPVTKFKGDRIEMGMDTEWSPWAGHNLLIGLTYADSDIDHAVDTRGGDTITEAFGVRRKNFSAGIQDQVEITGKFSLILGARYDDYDDIGNNLTNKVAGVYRLGEHHVVKAQYSEGFRAPTFWELYGSGVADDNLDFEKIDTTELAYIYRQAKAVGRLTLYSSKIDEGIFFSEGGGFANNVRIKSQGFEAEWEQQVSEKFRWVANVSYNDTKDDRAIRTCGIRNPPGIADWLGNLAFFLKPVDKCILTGRLLYVGDRHGTGDSIKGYESVDLALSRLDLFKSGLTIRAGMKNIFNDNIVYLTNFPLGLTEDIYRDRTFWIQMTKDF